MLYQLSYWDVPLRWFLLFRFVCSCLLQVWKPNVSSLFLLPPWDIQSFMCWFCIITLAQLRGSCQRQGWNYAANSWKASICKKHAQNPTASFIMGQPVMQCKSWSPIFAIQCHLARKFFFFNIFLAFFMALLIEQLKIWQETGGGRGGVTRSKGTQAGTRTRLHCRASAHGTHTLPTELNSAP